MDKHVCGNVITDGDQYNTCKPLRIRNSGFISDSKFGSDHTLVQRSYRRNPAGFNQQLYYAVYQCDDHLLCRSIQQHNGSCIGFAYSGNGNSECIAGNADCYNTCFSNRQYQL